MEDNNLNNNDPFFNVEPLHGSTNNNVQGTTNSVGEDSFSNVEPLQRRESNPANNDGQENLNSGIQNQQTDYVNSTNVENNNNFNGKKFVKGGSVFSTYIVIFIAFGILNSMINSMDIEKRVGDANQIGSLTLLGFRLAILTIIAGVVAVLISFFKKYTNDNGLESFKNYNFIAFGITIAFEFISRLISLFQISSSSSDVKTGFIINMVLIIVGLIATLFIVNMLVEKKFTKSGSQ